MKIVIIGSDESSATTIREGLAEFAGVQKIESIEAGSDSIDSIIEQGNKYDLAFCDERLSKESSDHVLSSLQEICGSMVYMVSGDSLQLKNTEDPDFFSCISKPVTTNTVQKLVEKFKAREARTEVEKKTKTRREITRIVGRRGYEFFNIPIESVSYFFTDNRIVYVVTRAGQKYLTEFNSLTELFDLLDGASFYRINRRFIVNLLSIKKFRTFEKLKIFIELEITTPDNLIVSQDNATHFRKWIREVY